MIIGFDGSRAFVAGRTGTENYSYQLLLNLSKIDKENQYIVYVRPDARTDVQNWPKNFQFKIINWPRLWTQGGLSIQTFQDNLDVLFVPAHTLPIIKKPGLKTVVTVHDLGSEYLPSMHQVKQRLYLGLMQKFQLKTASQIIAVSEATKKDLVKKIGIERNKIKVVYEGYDEELIKPVKGDRLVNGLRQYDLEPRKYFLFVGTVQPRKNLERLIRAYAIWSGSFSRKAPLARPDRSLRVGFAPIDNLIIDSSVRETAPVALAGLNFAIPKLALVGSKGWLSDEIYQLPKQLGIKDQVKFLGYVSEKDLPALYSGALALTFPSLFEGFGLPILEAQACGCPVLTSNISSMPEVAGKGAVYVDPYSVDDIVKGMESLQAVGNPPEARLAKGGRQQLVKAGFENVKRFSWEKAASETLEVLENI